MRIASLTSLLFTFAAAAFGAIENANVVAHPAGAALRETVASLRPPHGDDVWIAYALPAAAGRYTMCCWNDWNDGKEPAVKACRLTGGGGSFIERGDRADRKDRDPRGTHAKIDTSTMLVFLHYAAGGLEDVQVYSGGCRVDAGGRTVHRIEGASVDESLDLLEKAITAHEGLRTGQRALAAVAAHDSPRAAQVLERLALGKDAELRGEASFWLAQMGGSRGFEVVRRIAIEDESGSVRKKAVFALTQSNEPGVLGALTAIVRTHRDAGTRSEAIFWLGQQAGIAALPVLEERIHAETDREVKEKAIFAIGQVPGEPPIEVLARLARRDGDSYVRKQALFWLGQRAEKRTAALLHAGLDDPESEVREMAVFAISQRPHDEAVPALIDLARNHRDAAVRKKAIFWLSQMDDPRAAKAIERIVLQ